MIMHKKKTYKNQKQYAWMNLVEIPIVSIIYVYEWHKIEWNESKQVRKRLKQW